MTDDTPDDDVELVAYLDGELNPDAAAAVEARLAADPALRDRAAALRRSFDLLDFLPKPAPSAELTSRTLAHGPADRPAPVASPSRTELLPATPPPARRWAWPAGVAAAVAASFAIGYFGAAAVRGPVPVPHRDTDPGPLALADLRVVENLSLYAVADDLAFVDRLAAPDLFGDDAADPIPGPTPEPPKATGPAFDGLAAAFRALPADQRDRVRRLDHELSELPTPRRDRLRRVLEGYAGWLDRLPDAERAAVLAAPTADGRVVAIRAAKRARWEAALPPARRQQLGALPPAERDAALKFWKDQEDRRRERWDDAALAWEAARLGRIGPLDTDRARKQAAAFARAAYRPDDPARPTRLYPAEQKQLRAALDLAEKDGEWNRLGRVVYDLSRKYETLPEPAGGKPVLDFPDLWPAGRAYFDWRTKRKERITAAVGKWPEFALAVSAEAELPKGPAVPNWFALGPCRPADYPEEVRAVLPDLQKDATADEWKALVALEGKWPAHSRELVRLAKAHDRSVPGAMPPGPPSIWEKAFDPARRKG